jgi:endonuclease YncB( thermonuclease family)
MRPPTRRLAIGALALFCTLAGRPGPGAQVGPFPRGASDDAAPLICTRGAVIDGDTLALVCNGEPVRVRLYCIDAPEMGQGAWGRASREHLSAMMPGTVMVLPKPTQFGDRDRFGRIVAEVLAPGDPQRNLNLAQVLAGLAAVYPEYCTEDRYEWVEQVARRSKVGIWRVEGPQQTPWVQRHQR